ncbi:MAG: bifunctional folylpolyglutamate synthase/dihydrofolate synthase, partial [Deltaproteobacteria bacterium]|nr:bifunctional folylpolyglutamate synthase/dihydrofolate synthase [Deltaproteobacteria bacterium]
TSPQYERAGDPEQQANFVRSLNQDVLVIPRIPDAVSFAIDRATKNDAVCITGSLYTVGEAKAYLDSVHP